MIIIFLPIDSFSTATCKMFELLKDSQDTPQTLPRQRHHCKDSTMKTFKSFSKGAGKKPESWKD